MSNRIWTNLSNVCAGKLELFGGPAVSGDLAGYLRAEQMSLAMRNSLSTSFANIAYAIVLMVALIDSSVAAFANVWCGIVIVLASLLALKSHLSRRLVVPRTVSRHAIQTIVRGAFLLGCLWAVVPAVFFPAVTHGAQLIIVCVVAGMFAGCAISFASLPFAVIAFMGPILIGSAICIYRTADLTFALVGLLLIGYATVLLRGVFLHALEFTDRIMQRGAAETAVRHDTLTHLPNRVAFDEGLRNSLSRLDLTDHGFAVLLLDLDRFKIVSDRYGIAGSDIYLTEVAARLRRSARENDVVARIGGDAFALIAVDIEGADAAFAIAQQMCDSLTEPFMIDGKPFTGGASIGIALAPRDGTDPSDLIKHADIALHRAKKIAPCTIRFFEPGDDKTTRDNLALLQDLEGAVGRGELFLAYQPILHIADHRITGFEALLRWNHPQRGLVPPNQFIGLAEESGMIHAIGDWVIHQACADLARWPSDIRIAVNFSVAQLQNANIALNVVHALAQSNIAPSRLEIEITESMLISKYETAAATLDSLLQLGVTLALDDFGTGFSSLTYLRKLPFSRIKIDQSFVADMLVQPDSAAIVKSVLSLAGDMKIGVVAEGIETAEQLAFFENSSCEAVQGYFIGRPLPAAETSALLLQQRLNEDRPPARAVHAA